MYVYVCNFHNQQLNLEASSKVFRSLTKVITW